MTVNQRTRGLHPPRGAPRRRHDLQATIYRQSFPQNGNDIRAVVGYGELLEVRVSLSFRKIIIAVIAQSKIAGSHRLTDETQTNSPHGIEELLQYFFALRTIKFCEERPDGRVCDGSSEPFHLLIGLGRVYTDGHRRQASVAKRQRFFLLK